MKKIFYFLFVLMLCYLPFAPSDVINAAFRGVAKGLTFAILFGILGGIYWLYKYFFNKTKAPTNPSSSNIVVSEDKSQPAQKYEPDYVDETIWEKVKKEFESSDRREGLYARFFSECGGDENKAKAKYMDARVMEHKLASAVVAQTEKPKLPQETFKATDSTKISQKTFSIDENKYKISQRGKPNPYEKRFTLFYVIATFFGIVILVSYCTDHTQNKLSNYTNPAITFKT